MANHKFTYVVSGVDLSHDLKASISRAIAGAVAGALAQGPKMEGRVEALNFTKIYGGIWIEPSALSKTMQGELNALAEG